MIIRRRIVGTSAVRRGWCLAALILLLGLGVFFLNLGGYPLLDPDEGRYAEIAREMNESGDFLTPHLNYMPYLEKPPLYYWATALSLKIFGQNEWAVRSVPAIAGFFTLVLLMGTGARMLGPKVGLTAGWIYLTSLLPSVLARLAIIDTLFSCWLTAAWAAWWMGYRAGQGKSAGWWNVGAWLFLGLATMTKGPVALALSLLIVGIFIGLQRDWIRLRKTFWWPGPLLFLILVLPWHVAVGIENPQFWHYYLVDQHLGRALGNEHVKPFWFFVAILPFGSAFWGLFLFPAAGRAFRCVRSALGPCSEAAGGKPSGIAVPAQGPEEEGPLQPHSILYLSVWALSVVALFSLSRCKLVPYILPAYPPLALLIAWHLQSGGLDRRSTDWCLGVTSLLLLVPIAALPYAALAEEAVPFSELVIPLRWAQGALAMGALLVAAGIYRRRLALPAVGLIALMLMPSLFMTVQQVAKYRKIGALVEAMPQPLPEGIRVAEWRSYDRSLGFYLRRPVILVDERSELKPEHDTRVRQDLLLNGQWSLIRLSAQGPLLLNIRPSDWNTVKAWGIFHPVALNSRNMIVGNDSFLRLGRLRPWPEASIGPGPLVLPPLSEKAPVGESVLARSEGQAPEGIGVWAK